MVDATADTAYLEAEAEDTDVDGVTDTVRRSFSTGVTEETTRAAGVCAVRTLLSLSLSLLQPSLRFSSLLASSSVVSSAPSNSDMRLRRTRLLPPLLPCSANTAGEVT